MIAIFLGLFGSFWFAVGMIFINRGVLSIDFFRGLLVNLGVNSLFLWIYLLLFAESVDLWAPANLIFVTVGIFVPGVARFFIFKGMERLGASISSCSCRPIIEQRGKCLKGVYSFSTYETG